MKAILLLGDYAAVADGKLTIVGAGWSLMGPDPCPSAVALLLDVPWDQTNQPHHFSVDLNDGDGNAFTDPNGNPVQFGGEFEVGRPPGLPTGTSITVPLAVNIGPLPLTPGSRYVWELTVDDESDEDWRVAFNVRPEQGLTRLAS